MISKYRPVSFRLIVSVSLFVTWRAKICQEGLEIRYLVTKEKKYTKTKKTTGKWPKITGRSVKDIAQGEKLMLITNFCNTFPWVGPRKTMLAN